MAVIKMMALTLIGPNEEMEAVARQMVLMGGFQPLPLDLLLNDRNLRSRVNTETGNPYDDLLLKLGAVWKVAGESAPDPFPVPLDESFTLERLSREVHGAAGKLELWERRREFLAEELEELEATRICVACLSDLGRSPRDLAETEFVPIFFGRTTDENFKRLEESAEGAPLLVIPLRSSGGNTWTLVITVPGYLEGTKKLLETIYFREYSLQGVAERLDPQNPLGTLETRISQHRKAMEALTRAGKHLLSDHRTEYETLFSRVYTMQRVYDLCKGRGEVSGLFVLSGWIPADTLDSVKETVGKEAPRSSLMVEESGTLPYPGIRVPTLLRNLPLVRAFQDVVGLYSLPSYGEIDPSFFVALSFCLFFGFMFGDVGHGLILILGALFLQKKRILKKSLATVMKSAGTMSVVFGFLYGSVFGLEDVIPALWLSPMKDMGKLLGISIGLGVGMVSLGMVLNMVARYREGDFGRLLFDGGGLTGLVFYWSAAGALFAGFAGISLPFPSWAVSAALVGLLAIMFLRDVLARTLLHQKKGAPGEEEPGFLHFFEVLHGLLSFLSNTASFVRLAAFALNHVGLSLAVLMLSEMVHELPGGLFFKVVILVLGNAVIVALEGLIVFIQTLRLEYYEFFSKFYRGGGKAFHPVRWNRPERARTTSS